MSVTIHQLLRYRRQRMKIVLLVVCAIGLLGIGYAALVRRGIGIPCVFHTVTSLRCPGCGISRALAALIHGRIDLFFAYNLAAPLILFYLIFVAFFTAREYVLYNTVCYRSPCKWLDIGMLVGMVIWWVARNLFGI